MKKFLSDLFKGPNNDYWDLARIMSAWAILSFTFSFLWALLRLKSVPDWASLGTGFGAVLLGAGAYIGIKDFSRAKAIETQVNTAVVAAGNTGNDSGSQKAYDN